MVKMVPLICPKCGADLEVKEDTKTCFCTYCGAKLIIDDGSETVTINKNININKVTRDETKIEEARLKEKSSKMTLIVLAILIIVMYVFAIIATLL